MPRIKRSEYELLRQEELKEETKFRQQNKKIATERQELQRETRRLARESSFSVSHDIPKLPAATNSMTPKESHNRVTAGAFERAEARRHNGVRYWNHRYYATFSGLALVFEGDKTRQSFLLHQYKRLLKEGLITAPKPHRFRNQVPNEKYFEILPEFVEAMGWDMNTLHEWKKAQDDNA